MIILKQITVFSLLCCLSLGCFSAKSEAVHFERSDNNRFYATANPDWSQPTVQHDQWGSFDRQVRDHHPQGIYWLSFDIYLGGEETATFDWQYFVNMLAAQEVYWDDVYLGNNGQPAADKADEIPGYVWTSYLIPNHLMTPGKHVLKIKASSHYRFPAMKLLKEGWITQYDPQFRLVSFWSLLPSLLISIAAVVGLYFLMLFFAEGRSVEHLVFFLLLESITVYGYAIQWPHLIGYRYHWEPLNLLLEVAASIGIWLLLPSYFLYKYQSNRKGLWLLAGILCVAVPSLYIGSIEVYLVWFICFATALCISVYYGFKNRKHLWWESLGILLCMLAVLSQDLENLYLYFPALFALILLTQAIAVQQRKNALKQASLVETQLKAELLRKHIQPHFLLNTLTSLIEWVETDTERSVEFIAVLAEEFRLLSRISEKPLVEMKTELSLVEKHLKIMSLRLRKNCFLTKRDVQPDEQIPPAVIHTLLENAFSHNVYQGDSVEFIIERQTLDGALDGALVRYTFIAPIGVAQSDNRNKIGSGTGRRYIEARLNQSFGEHWQMIERSDDKVWVTEFTLDYNYLQMPEVTDEK